MPEPGATAPTGAVAGAVISARTVELTPAGSSRRFLVIVPAAQVHALRDARLRSLAQDRAADAAPWPPELRERIAISALAEAARRAGDLAVEGLLRRLALPALLAPRTEILESPPDGDLILRVRLWTLPELALPDPAALRIERLEARPSAAELDRALAELAATRAAQVELPEGTPAAPGDELVCDIQARLLPPLTRIPQPGLDGAAPGSPGRLPEGWSFGDNGAGLAAEILLVAPEADPPHLRLRVHGTAAADGQSYVIFHPPGAIPVLPGGRWAGSVALRAVGTPLGLRGGKLRLQSQPASGEGSLRRKDAPLALRGAGFVRCYVSDGFPEPGTAFLRLPLLFDHAAGRVDFTLDIGPPRLVEGLDLGQGAEVPLPEFSVRGRRFVVGGATDPAFLAPHLAALAAGESREVVLRLPEEMEDRALAGREARFTLRAAALRRRVATVPDEALARGLGFAGLDAMRASVATRVSEGYAALSRLQVRRALLDALLAAAGDLPLPEEAVHAAYAAIWPRLSAAAAERGEAPPRQEAVMEVARRRLRLGLLLGAVARRHGLEAEASSPAAGAPGPEALPLLALEERTIAFLMERAQVTTREVPREELLARAAE